MKTDSPRLLEIHVWRYILWFFHVSLKSVIFGYLSCIYREPNHEPLVELFRICSFIHASGGSYNKISMANFVLLLIQIYEDNCYIYGRARGHSLLLVPKGLTMAAGPFLQRPGG